MSKMVKTFMIKEAIQPGPPAETALLTSGRKQVDRLTRQMFAKMEQALAEGHRDVAASEARRAATEIQMVLEQLAQEVLQ
jgi:hypothetical protein